MTNHFSNFTFESYYYELRPIIIGLHIMYTNYYYTKNNVPRHDIRISIDYISKHANIVY